MLKNTRLALAILLAGNFGASAVAAENVWQYSGPQLFQRFCASCHGRTGEGNGTVAPFFKLLPPDLTQLARRNGGSFPAEKIQQIIDGRLNVLPHGAREMPIWGLQFSAAEADPDKGKAQAASTISQLVEYLRTIQTK